MGVRVLNMIEDFSLEILVDGNPGEEITVSDLNRPGLQFAGFYSYFATERVQIVGKAEWSFLDSMQEEMRKKRLIKYFQLDIPCTILTRDMEPHIEILNEARKNKKWVLRTDDVSTRFISRLTNYLEEKLAPEIRMHGVLVDVYGTGILILGESGIGKSETALEIIKRGHRLVADDAVDIKNIGGVLKGFSPYITKGMMEVRGLGIIDVPTLYGLSTILDEKIIELVIYLEQWEEDNKYERLGLDHEVMEILDVSIRKLVIPIRPGRNLAVIIEAAAANIRHSNSPIEIIENRINQVAEWRKRNER